MSCMLCGGKGFYKIDFKGLYYLRNCDCDSVVETIGMAKEKLKYLKEEKVDESKYVMDESMIMSIAHLFLEMQDYDSMMEYASLLDGVDLGN